MITALYDYIMSLPLIDSCEFIPPSENLRPHRDIIAEFLSDSPAVSLISAGMSANDLAMARGDKMSVPEKWELILPYWSRARFTLGCRAVEFAARELYGFDSINRDSIEALDESFKLTFGGGRYNYILKERCNIDFTILTVPPTSAASAGAAPAGAAPAGAVYTGNASTAADTAASLPHMNADRRYFLPAVDVGKLVSPDSREALLDIGREVGVTVSAFDDYLEACKKQMELLATQNRVLTCETSGRLPTPIKTSYSDARGAFDSYMKSLRSAEPAALQRYLYRFILGLASGHSMTFRLDEASLSCAISDDPDCFLELCELYPNLKFDVMVSAYPHRRKLGHTAGLLPNVYVNLSFAENAVAEYLELIPFNKIIAFGGGCHTVDAIYGRAVLTRENLSRVLSEKIALGITKLGDAKIIARALLNGNAKKLYLNDK